MKRVPLQRGDKPLQRRTALKPGTPLQRKTGMPRPTSPLPRQGTLGSSRESTPTRTPLKAVPRPVSPEERHAKAVVLERSGGWCEMGCGGPGRDWSHRRSAAHGGKWRPTNGLRACRRCHAACEVEAPLLADAGGWRIVKRDPDPATVPVYLQAHGSRLEGWYYLTDGTDITPAPEAPVPAWFPWMPRPKP